MAEKETTEKRDDAPTEASEEPDGEADLDEGVSEEAEEAADPRDESDEAEPDEDVPEDEDAPEEEAAPAKADDKKAFLEKQRTREETALDLASDFPEKHRLEGEMEGADDETKLDLFERIVRTREFDARMRKLFRQGRFEGTFYSQIGQEACDVVIAAQLHKEDFVGPSHRDLGASVGKGVPLKYLAAHVYNRVDSPDEGRYTACHYWHPEYWIMQPGTSIMMNWITATGAAFGFKMLKKDNVAVAFGGDGATAHGDFHEGCNFAGVHDLPIVYVIQNNLWAESLPLSLTTAVDDLSERAKAFGFPGISIDGNDVVEVWNATREALERARGGDGPTLIEMKTYRWFGHSDIDPADYRSDDEVRAWMEKDPVPRFAAWLKEHDVIDDEAIEEIQRKVREEVEEAIEFAEDSPRPDAESFLSEVYAEEYPGFDIRAGR